MSGEDDIKREIPHLIVLGILLLILLFVVTKFKWVHCSQVPGNWCSVYCGISGHSRIALVSGDSGTGNPSALYNLSSNAREYTFISNYPAEAISASQLRGFELVIFERMTRLTPKQEKAVREYADSGGNIIWIADAGTQRYLTPGDLQDALNRNESDPGYYEWYVKEVNRTKGFGALGSLFKATFQRMENSTSGKPLYLKVADRDALATRGMNFTFETNARQAAVINPDVSAAQILYSVYGTKTCTFASPCPAIIAHKYVGYVVYSAIPLEDIKSVTALANLYDFLVSC
ncbi:MAG: hypothetical protein V1787_00270 [Candidatus Micrarchaeota archaeon]